MTRPPVKAARHVALVQLIPNMLTIAAICAGLTAVRFAVQGSFVHATLLIIIACILDGLDGKIARLMRSSSKMGAELDSLADFANFGVAPALVLYFWALQDMRGFGWMAVLVYAICCAVRLARFNIGEKSDSVYASDGPCAKFVGVPAPAGAILVMLPMFISFAFDGLPRIPDVVICLHLVIVGLAMICTIPTYSFKNSHVSRDNVKFLLVGFAVFAAAALTHFWVVMIVLCLGYVGMVIWGPLVRVAQANRKGH